MKRSLSLLSLTVLFVPTVASAMTASELMAHLEAVPSSTLSLTVQTKRDSTYATIWLNGTVGLQNPTMDIRVTVDVAEGSTKSRIKGAVRIIPEGTYFRIDSISGSVGNAILSASEQLPTGQWVQVLPSAIAESMLSESDWFSAMTGVSDNANDVFNVQEVPSKSGKTFVVGLRPDATAALAESLLDLMGGDRPVVQDFFPWRAFAESMNFQTIVSSTANGTPTSRNTKMDVTGSRSYIRITSAEKFLSEVPTYPVPEGALTYEHIWQFMIPTDFESSLSISSFTPIFPDASFDTIDTGDTLTESFGVRCATTNELRMLSLQRSGECAVEKVSRRNLTRNR